MGLGALGGKRIVVTRPRSQAADLCRKIEAFGGVPLRFPCIQIVSRAGEAPVTRAIKRLKDYDWVVFTSVNGVNCFFSREDANAAELRSVCVAAVGPATAAALERHGCTARVMPDEYIAERVAAVMGDVRGQEILLARAAKARLALALRLADAGARVDDVAFYDTVAAAPDPTESAQLAQGFEAITFTSSSTVRHFLKLVPSQDLLNASTVIACIGPVTAQTARQHGLTVTGVATRHTTDGLVDLLCRVWNDGSGHD